MLTASRNLDVERALTREPGIDVDELIAFAEQRAGEDPLRDPAARDFGLEAREELADARNYLVWLAQEAGADVSAALRGVAIAFNAVPRAQGV